MSEYAPPPYRLEREVFSGDGEDIDYIDYVIVSGELGGEEHEIARVCDEDIGEFIVRACNSHEELLDAARGVLDAEPGDLISINSLRLAVAKAEGRQ